MLFCCLIMSCFSLIFSPSSLGGINDFCIHPLVHAFTSRVPPFFLLGSMHPVVLASLLDLLLCSMFISVCLNSNGSYLLAVNHDMRSNMISCCSSPTLLGLSDATKGAAVSPENTEGMRSRHCRSILSNPAYLLHTSLDQPPQVHVQLTTAAPSASASLLAFRRTSPRSPITVSRTTPRSSPSSSSSAAEPAPENEDVDARTSSQRPKAQLRIHHCRRGLSSESSASASVAVIGGAVAAKRIKPFTRYTLSFGSRRRAAESVGSSSNGSASDCAGAGAGASCAAMDPSGLGWG